jgi:hypothetical protein
MVQRHTHSNLKPEIDLAIAQALAWLEAQGLIVPAEGMNGNNGWRHFSRRAGKFQNEAEFANYAVARRLPKEALHPSISGPVRMSFMRGDFDTAAFQAMKAVEVAVREAAGLAAADIGTKLMRKALDMESGPLTDSAAEPAERQALSDLFAGAIVPQPILSGGNPNQFRIAQTSTSTNTTTSTPMAVPAACACVSSSWVISSSSSRPADRPITGRAS